MKDFLKKIIEKGLVTIGLVKKVPKKVWIWTLIAMLVVKYVKILANFISKNWKLFILKIKRRKKKKKFEFFKKKKKKRNSLFN